MAEFLAIVEGLHLARREKCPVVIICSDCRNAISSITQDQILNEEYSCVLNICREVKQEFQDVRFEFVRREENRLVDALAKDNRSLDWDCNILRNLSEPPNLCNDIIMADCNRIFRPESL